MVCLLPSLGDVRLPLRFWEKILVNDDCWIWTGATSGGSGYGRIGVGSRSDSTRRTVGCHRFAYEALVGPIPDGLLLDHLCRNRLCANPGHLEPVSSRENTLRGKTLAAAQVTRTHCPHGHPYSGPNLYQRPCGRRACRTCMRSAGRRHYWRSK